MARKIFDIVVDPYKTKLEEVEFPVGQFEVVAINTFDAGFGEHGVVFTIFGDDSRMMKTKLIELKRGETFDEGDRLCEANLQFLGVAKGDCGPVNRGTYTDPTDVFYFKEVY